MPSRASSAVIRISVLAFLIALSSRAQETNSTNPPVPEEAKAVEVNWLYGAYVPREIPLVTLTGRQRFKLYLAQSFTTPGIYIKSTVFSLSAQITNSPPEWEGGIAGYGRRFGSRYGQSLIQNTLSSAGNALLGYEPRYDRCRCTGFWPRTGHAFIRNFVTYNRTEKQLRPQFALYAGALGSGAISSLWFPGKPNAWVEGYQAMILQAGWGPATNWVGESLPRGRSNFEKKEIRSQARP
jgi:hypothetical protein